MFVRWFHLARAPDTERLAAASGSSHFFRMSQRSIPGSSAPRTLSRASRQATWANILVALLDKEQLWLELLAGIEEPLWVEGLLDRTVKCCDSRVPTGMAAFDDAETVLTSD